MSLVNQVSVSAMMLKSKVLIELLKDFRLLLARMLCTLNVHTLNIMVSVSTVIGGSVSH